MWSRMGRNCAFGACTTSCYIGLIVVAMNGITRYIVVTNKDITSFIARKDMAHTRMHSDLTDNKRLRDGIVHIQFDIVRCKT